MKKQFIISTIAIFILLTAAFYGLNHFMPGYSFEVLEAGNALMALLSLIAWMLIQKQLSDRPQAFVRGVYSSSFLKLMVCMVAILVYVLLNRTHIHKPTVFLLFGIYAIYTIMETVLLSKLVRD